MSDPDGGAEQLSLPYPMGDRDESVGLRGFAIVMTDYEGLGTPPWRC
jgi:hypothetical protein